MEELNLCPKCGGCGVLDHCDDGTYMVKCWWDYSCGHKTGNYDTEAEAVKAWNEGGSE